MPSTSVENKDVRPYLLDGCPFKLTTFIMRSCFKPVKAVYEKLELLDTAATSKKKPMECSSGCWNSGLVYTTRTVSES